MINTYLFTKSGVTQDVAVEDRRELTQGECCLLWVDARSVTDGDMGKLAECFGLHAIAVEACTDGYRRPHLYEFDNHFYVNMTTLRQGRGSHGVKPHELHLFVGGRFIITVTKEDSSEAVDQALGEYLNTPGLFEQVKMPLGDVALWSAGIGVAITATLLYAFRKTGWL